MFKLYGKSTTDNASFQGHRASGGESQTSSLAHVDLSATVSDSNSNGASYLKYSVGSLSSSAGMIAAPSPQHSQYTFSRWDSFEQVSEPADTENEEFAVLSFSTGSDAESGSRSYSLLSHPVSESRSQSLNNSPATFGLATKQAKSVTPAYVISLSDSEMASARLGSQSALSLLGTEKYSGKNLQNDKPNDSYRFRVMKSLDHIDQQKPKFHRYTRGDFQLIFEYLTAKKSQLQKKQQQSFQQNQTRVTNIPSVFGEHKDLLFQLSLEMST